MVRQVKLFKGVCGPFLHWENRCFRRIYSCLETSTRRKSSETPLSHKKWHCSKKSHQGDEKVGHTREEWYSLQVGYWVVWGCNFNLSNNNSRIDIILKKRPRVCQNRKQCMNQNVLNKLNDINGDNSGGRRRSGKKTSHSCNHEKLLTTEWHVNSKLMR